MAQAATAIDLANPRLLQEKLERTREQILALQEDVDKYSDVAATIAELPKKLKHDVMVPIGTRAMMPGKIVRSNEILAHLGDEYFAWKTAVEAVDVIDRKKKALAKQIKAEEESLDALQEKKKDVNNLLDIQKLYEDENIKEIHETEEESESHLVSRATEEDIENYFEIEEEERVKNEGAEWDWDEMMKRVEELEAMEDRGDDVDEETKEPEPPALSKEEQVAQLKAKGNDAFGKRRFKESIDWYTKAIDLDSSSHILYGNRAAAYHRLKQYTKALADAKKAVELDGSWVKGHYRMASALSALERYEEAAEAFEQAFELCPTDEKLKQQANEMRAKTRPSASAPSAPAPAKVLPPKDQPTPSPTPVVPPPPAAASDSVASKVFSGSILERDVVQEKPVVSAPASTGAFPTRRPSRFMGNNPDGKVVTFEPVGQPEPVKRVSRFKAQRSGGAQ
ncbi:hypothetical protein Poli38472_003164 [Pythium oligandrum]|uniref:Hsp70-Hsp90 organising protein n=1 Tax=Pythium oligandrum TaxID=41045 RepID=A0A8K1FDT2_PYTOL|nr:hypothetical protein Poli38472_003164 [Pythium oligandrum]|eukprot:TMW57239.1 hypothetical protein Poli38472_003164 [Pythium oligandrum]